MSEDPAEVSVAKIKAAHAVEFMRKAVRCESVARGEVYKALVDFQAWLFDLPELASVVDTGEKRVVVIDNLAGKEAYWNGRLEELRRLIIGVSDGAQRDSAENYKESKRLDRVIDQNYNELLNKINLQAKIFGEAIENLRKNIRVAADFCVDRPGPEAKPDPRADCNSSETGPVNESRGLSIKKIRAEALRLALIDARMSTLTNDLADSAAAYTFDPDDWQQIQLLRGRYVAALKLAIA